MTARDIDSSEKRGGRGGGESESESERERASERESERARERASERASERERENLNTLSSDALAIDTGEFIGRTLFYVDFLA
jgi:hypothetical protein